MSFGTAGLRSKMGAGNSQMNDLTIIQTTQVNEEYFCDLIIITTTLYFFKGFLAYLKTVFPNLNELGIVVGFDGRHHSNRLVPDTYYFSIISFCFLIIPA